MQRPPSQTQTPPARPIRLAGLALCLVLAGGDAAAEEWEKLPQPEALIGTGENIDRHEEGAENIDNHEGQSGLVSTHEGRPGSLDASVVGTEQLDDHESGSRALPESGDPSERLFGTGHDPESPEARLAQARARLRAARAAHRSKPAPEPSAQAFPAARTEVDESAWRGRLNIQKHRIDVATAKASMMDAEYANMLQRDYPRGQARQDLIDERDAARRRARSEADVMAKLLQRARNAGMEPGSLSAYDPAD